MPLSPLPNSAASTLWTRSATSASCFIGLGYCVSRNCISGRSSEKQASRVACSSVRMAQQRGQFSRSRRSRSLHPCSYCGYTVFSSVCAV
jgi:hypothetical protein